MLFCGPLPSQAFSSHFGHLELLSLISLTRNKVGFLLEFELLLFFYDWGSPSMKSHVRRRVENSPLGGLPPQVFTSLTWFTCFCLFSRVLRCLFVFRILFRVCSLHQWEGWAIGSLGCSDGSGEIHSFILMCINQDRSFCLVRNKIRYGLVCGHTDMVSLSTHVILRV